MKEAILEKHINIPHIEACKLENAVRASFLYEAEDLGEHELYRLPSGKLGCEQSLSSNCNRNWTL